MDEMDRLFRQSDFSAESEGLGTRIWNRVIRRKEEPVIMPIHKNEITEEMMMQAMQCKDADEDRRLRNHKRRSRDLHGGT